MRRCRRCRPQARSRRTPRSTEQPGRRLCHRPRTRGPPRVLSRERPPPLCEDEEARADDNPDAEEGQIQPPERLPELKFRLLGVPDGLLDGFGSHYPHVPLLSGPDYDPYTHDTEHSTSFYFLVLYRATCTRAM